MLLFRTPVLRFGRPGVKPADFAALGTDPSPLDNDADLPADADSEWLWALLTPLPGSGTTQVNDSGGYALTGAADGTYTQAYRGLVMPPTGAVTVYESSITVTVGAVGAGVAVETDSALQLAARQIAAVGLSVETSSALALGRAAGFSPAVETDTAFALTPVAGNAPGIAVETDSALSLTARSILAAGIAGEADTAMALPARVVLPTGMAVETSTALALLAGYAANLAVETDTALALMGRQLRAVGLCLETDTAYARPAAGSVVDQFTAPRYTVNLRPVQAGQVVELTVPARPIESL